MKYGEVKNMKNQNVTDMTTGSPLKHIFRFALPLFIGNLFQQLYNMVDAVIVGNFVGSDELAAVGNCGSVNFLFVSLCMGLSVGIGIIVAQYFGSKDYEMVQKTIGNAIYVLFAASILVGVLCFAMAPILLKLLHTPDDIIGTSILYMRTTSLGILGIALYNGVAAVLRALGDSKTSLYFLIVSCVVNVILDLLFVLGFNWGVFGVAFATVVAQYICAVACLIFAYKKVTFFQIKRKHMTLHSMIITKAFGLGIPIALQSSLISISMMVLQGVVNSFGKDVMSAYTIVGRIEQIVQQPFGSIGMALTSYTGQNIGAKKMERVREGYRKSVWIVFAYSMLMLPIVYFFGEEIISIFGKKPEVISIGAKALMIDCVCYFPLALIYVPRAVLNGLGDNRFAMINGLTEVGCRIGYSKIFTSIPALGYLGIFVTTGVTWITTAIVCVGRYWLKCGRVREEA